MAACSLAQAQSELDRLVDEALTGETVTITRDGRPVVTLAPTAPPTTPTPIDEEYIEWMRKRREARPSLGGDAVTLVRETRDEER
jgi:prevent-host-death family protein